MNNVIEIYIDESANKVDKNNALFVFGACCFVKNYKNKFRNEIEKQHKTWIEFYKLKKGFYHSNDTFWLTNEMKNGKIYYKIREDFYKKQIIKHQINFLAEIGTKIEKQKIFNNLMNKIIEEFGDDKYYEICFDKGDDNYKKIFKNYLLLNDNKLHLTSPGDCKNVFIQITDFYAYKEYKLLSLNLQKNKI